MTRHRLDFDRELLRELLPHRPPMALIDRALELRRGTRPTLRAERTVDPGDPVLAGHFPGRPIWPGVLTIEGLAQTAQLLVGLEALAEASEDPDRAFATLRDGGAPPVPAARGLLAAVEVKLTAPVGPGARLDYRATMLERRLGMIRCEVEAHVRGRAVARGRLTVAEER